jgi:hypothetical protein
VSDVTKMIENQQILAETKAKTEGKKSVSSEHVPASQERHGALPQ